MGEFASKGVAGAALGTGIGGLALGVLNGAGGLLNLMGGNNCAGNCAGNAMVDRYELGLVQELVPVCDVCHIYDNSTKSPYRIFKKRKELCWYCTQRYLWHKEDIVALTGVENVQKAALN